MSHRQIFKLNTLKKLLTAENSCVSLVQSTRLLALPPFFLNDMKSGILYQLNTMLKKYDRSLGGIVVGYQNIKVLMDENTGIIPIGTSETEVNISVEFYIFQPKIGSYLEGVINKKSSTHIGCLVHQYFNASILKPEDVSYQDWSCRDLNVDDKITFKVKDLDFTSLLPYIEGVYEKGVELGTGNLKKSRSCDIDNVMMVRDVISSEPNVPFSRDVNSRMNREKNSDDDFISDKKGKNDNGELGGILSGNKSEIDGKGKKNKKKKKKDETVLVDDFTKIEEDKNSKEPDTTSIQVNNQGDDGSHKKKKKKKSKEEKGNNEATAEIEKNEMPMNYSFTVNEKLVQIEDENSNDFIKIDKNRKEKKKRKCQNEEPLPSLNKTNECLPTQETDDSVFYSTQLEPSASKKMRISFCSPILKGVPPEAEPQVTAPGTPVRVNREENHDEIEKDVKKKQKKRKKEKKEESEDSPTAKKAKMSENSTKEEKNEHMNGNSLVQTMMEELLKQQLNRVREEFNISSSDKESCKEEKKKKEGKKRKKESKANESEKSQVNGDEKETETESTLEKLCRQELQRVKEELSMSDRESFKEGSKSKTKKEGKETSKEKLKDESSTTNAQFNSTIKKEVKSEEKTFKEINRSKEEANSFQEKKKKKPEKHKELSEITTQTSLLDKLLKDARSAIDEEKDNSNLLPPKENKRKKKDSEVSSASTNDSRKKTKQKKQKDCHETPVKFKNGSMYDVLDTPEKIDPDKSLFSDSESQSSPAKRRGKEINGETEKPKVQTLLDEFYKEETKRLKSESDKETPRSSEKKSKSKSKNRKSESDEKEESLYEKLLKQAKSLIEVRGKSTSPSAKKEKKNEGKKKQKTAQDCAKT